MPKLVHYRNKCIGCGICYQQQPLYWRMSKKDGKATLLNAVTKKDVQLLTVSEETAEVNLSLIAACPVRVIKLM
ncbi:ferredoxin [Lacibacter luteus]|uniref:Ferredoxin n=1 Tax=Lacibacter luteus TaxID=2508719 RepID=A0A4Q1CDI6_9BACT|nr:ferredoxin [Lacibacter luteus]RXK57713.1 ferredoxin [Lacibacter luteus]